MILMLKTILVKQELKHIWC